MPANRKTLRSEEERQDDDGGVRRPRLFDLSDVDDDDGEQEGHVDEADADAVTDENREIEHSVERRRRATDGQSDEEKGKDLEDRVVVVDRPLGGALEPARTADDECGETALERVVAEQQCLQRLGAEIADRIPERRRVVEHPSVVDHE
jgi:hypothetical protein